MAGFCWWLGALLAIALLTHTCLSWAFLTGNRPSHLSRQAAIMVMISIVPTAVYCILVLRLGWRLSEVPRLSVLSQRFKEWVRALILPREEKEFYTTVLRSSLSPEEIERRLFAEALAIVAHSFSGRCYVL